MLMNKKRVIEGAILILALAAAGGGWWFFKLEPKEGAPCEAGQVLSTPDGKVLSCVNGVQWKQEDAVTIYSNPGGYDLSKAGCVVTGPDGKRITFDMTKLKEGYQALIPNGSTIVGDCFPDK